MPRNRGVVIRQAVDLLFLVVVQTQWKAVPGFGGGQGALCTKGQV